MEFKLISLLGSLISRPGHFPCHSPAMGARNEAKDLGPMYTLCLGEMESSVGSNESVEKIVEYGLN